MKGLRLFGAGIDSFEPVLAGDVARTILFAAFDDAAMVNGSVLIVDGAQLAGPSSAHFE